MSERECGCDGGCVCFDILEAFLDFAKKHGDGMRGIFIETTFDRLEAAISRSAIYPGMPICRTYPPSDPHYVSRDPK